MSMLCNGMLRLSQLIHSKPQQQQEYPEKEEKMIPLFSVEGNIGAGKGTLLQSLQRIAQAQQMPLFIIPTPFTQQTGDWLHKLYSDMDRNAFAFQIHSLNQQLCSLLDVYYTAVRTPGAILLSEHSLHSITSVFTAALHTLNHITDEQAALVGQLSKTLQTVLQLLQIRECGYIYLQSSVGECVQRQQAVASSLSNTQVNKAYISSLDAVYSVMLQTRQLPCFLLESTYTPDHLHQLLRWMQQKSHASV